MLINHVIFLSMFEVLHWRSLGPSGNPMMKNPYQSQSYCSIPLEFLMAALFQCSLNQHQSILEKWQPHIMFQTTTCQTGMTHILGVKIWHVNTMTFFFGFFFVLFFSLFVCLKHFVWILLFHTCDLVTIPTSRNFLVETH